MATCGASGNASCCTSLEVMGGAYHRSYDGLTYPSLSGPATVSGFRLDQYEVTVGRMRQYVSYLAGGGSLPTAGAGIHTHLNGGQGLAATAGGYETGWDTTWNASIATTASGWNSNLAEGTWTANPGSNEGRPITAVAWYEAYAFCIWDGGFLPSESEWNYAAAGGGDQRAYPWSSAYPPGSTSISCADANYLDCTGGDAGPVATSAVGSLSPAGDGKWGQSDLAGNAWEWTLDSFNVPYVTPCVDCANLTSGNGQVLRGGSFLDDQAAQLVSFRDNAGPGVRSGNVGARCARIP
jgi:formylglycine-generating enzyme